MGNIISTAENGLSALYGNIRRSKARCVLVCGIIYTLLFTVIFVIAGGRALSEYGYLLGADGVMQYLPFLVQLRRDLLAFFGSIAQGAPAIPMVDLNYAFGADTVTSVAPDFIPMLPFYVFSVFLPESAMAAFLTSGMVLLTYLSGITFTAMCVHFGKDPLLSAAVAPVYAFCGNYWFSGWGNPHFLYPFVAFPLMIIGIDRIINGKNGILLSLSVAFPALGGVHLLFYSVPFVVIFAAIRVYYVHKGAYFRSLGKYFLIGVLYTLLGTMLAAVALLPFMYSLFSSGRTLGDDILTLSDMITPDIRGISKMIIGGINPTNCYGTWLAAIPLYLCALTRHREKNELRAYSIAALVLMIFPFTSYAVNGFQYLLCRWGFVTGALMAYICVEYIPMILKPKKGDTAFTVFISAAYLLSVTLTPGFFSIIPLLIIAGCCIIAPLRKLLTALINKLADTLRNIPAKLKGEERYSTILVLTIIFVVLFGAVFIIVSAKLYKAIPIAALVTLLTIAAVLLSRFTKKTLPSALLVAVMFAAAGSVYDSGIMDGSVYRTYQQVNSLYRTLSEQPRDPDEAGRYAYIGDVAESFFPSDDLEKRDILQRFSNRLANDEKRYLNGIPLMYDLPVAELFNSTINGNYISFIDRTGMDGQCISSPGEVWAYSGKEVMYSLFGVNKLYTVEKCPYIYGFDEYKQLPVEGFETYIIYDNRYALPLGSTYDKVMSRDRYNGFNPAELPYAMMNEVWLDGYDTGVTDSGASYSRECSFDLEKTFRGTTNVGIDCYDNKLTINDSTKGCFLYLSFDGVRSGSEFLLVGYADSFYVDMDNGMTREFKILNPLFDSPWKYYTDHYTLTFGYCEEDMKELNFVSPFEYENVKVYAVPAEVYTDAYAERCAETLHDVTTGINTLSGKITVSSDKILSIDLLYSKGWDAYVDGQKTDIYRANGLFLGIPLSEGSHDVTIVYHTPLMLEGAVLSLAGTAIIIAISVISAKKERKQKR